MVKLANGATALLVSLDLSSAQLTRNAAVPKVVPLPWRPDFGDELEGNPLTSR